jgi:hypothetical protein
MGDHQIPFKMIKVNNFPNIVLVMVPISTLCRKQVT